MQQTYTYTARLSLAGTLQTQITLRAPNIIAAWFGARRHLGRPAGSKLSVGPADWQSRVDKYYRQQWQEARQR